MDKRGVVFGNFLANNARRVRIGLRASYRNDLVCVNSD